MALVQRTVDISTFGNQDPEHKTMKKNIAEIAEISAARSVKFASSVRLILLMALTIFLVEAMVMIVIGRLRLPSRVEALVDPVLLVVIISPVLYLVLFRPMLQHISDLRRMEKSLKETEKHLRHLSVQLLSAQEQERSRISRELHDELGQSLALMKLQVRQVQNRLRSDQVDLRNDCEHVLNYIDQVIEDVRRLSLDLSPAVLERHGLTAALRWLVDNLNKSRGLNVFFDPGNGDLDRLFPLGAGTHIYRIVQESLTNIGKHAQARNASVIVSARSGMVSFLVTDDGRGIDMRRQNMEDHNKWGMGMSAMEERVRMLGGRLDIWSEEGKGTRITFSVPGRKTGDFQ
jgi:signal transduction histidine kinase